MAWLAVNEIGEEIIFQDKPKRMIEYQGGSYWSDRSENLFGHDI